MCLYLSGLNLDKNYPPQIHNNIVMVHLKKPPGRMKRFLFLITISLLTACKTEAEKAPNDQTEGNLDNAETFSENQTSELPGSNEAFKKYLELFKKADLPLNIKGCRESEIELNVLDGKKFKQFNEDYSFSYRQIPTNGSYIATVTLGVADCYLPVLTTYKLNGQIIDKKTIAIGYCGSGCGYSCEEFMSIAKDFSIYASDTVSTYNCDSLGLEIPGTYEYYVIYKEGKLLPDGKIQLSEEIKEPLEGRKKGF